MTLILAAALGAAIFSIFYGYQMKKQVSAIDPLVMARADRTASPHQGKIDKRSKWLIRATNRCTELARHVDLLPVPHDIDQRLAWAGLTQIKTVEMFRGEQLLNLLATASVGWMFGFWYNGPLLGLALLIVGAGLGVYMPLLQLASEGKKRQAEITIQLPDAIDLINTSVVAGLDVDRAITYTADNMDAPVSEEFHTFLSELKLGTPRQEAYRRLMWRNNSDELQSTISALLQGQSLGVPISDTLASQAEAMRERRLQRAKEAGAKASPRISLLMTLLVMPSVFIMFIAIMAYQVWGNFGPTFSNLAGG